MKNMSIKTQKKVNTVLIILLTIALIVTIQWDIGAREAFTWLEYTKPYYFMVATNCVIPILGFSLSLIYCVMNVFDLRKEELEEKKRLQGM